MSRITQGKIELQPHAESLAGVIASVAESVQPAMEAREHEFVVRLPDDPLLIVADRIRIAQAIFNVIENAAKYTRPGGHVLLRASRDGGDAVITVKDDGIGIAPGMVSKIFDMFVQADGGGRRAQGGLGIGLALSKKLIEMHHGSISVSSRGLGQGAEFTIRLPLSANDLPQAAAAEIDVSPPADARRVLIVDDNIDAADSLCALLTISGHTAKTVYRGADALQQLSQFKPDVVLLDIGLPDVDGYEVARRARAQCGPHCPTLVALSGWGQEEDKEHAREAGIDVHLTKPVDVATLTRVLGSVPPR
jgi:CheY-like chemotaxis protein